MVAILARKVHWNTRVSAGAQTANSEVRLCCQDGRQLLSCFTSRTSSSSSRSTKTESLDSPEVHSFIHCGSQNYLASLFEKKRLINCSLQPTTARPNIFYTTKLKLAKLIHQCFILKSFFPHNNRIAVCGETTGYSELDFSNHNHASVVQTEKGNRMGFIQGRVIWVLHQRG